MDIADRKMTKGWRALSGLYFLCVAVVITAGSLAPGTSGRVAVVMLPGRVSAAEVVAAADGRILRTGAGEMVAIADGAEPDFIAKLYRAGAFLVASPGLAEACL